LSTTFEVYPGQGGIPTFQQLLTRTTKHFCNQLEAANFPLEPELCFKLVNAFNYDQPVSRCAPLLWQENQYAWFYLRGLTGGIEVNRLRMESVDRENWRETLEFTSQDEEQQDFFGNCLANGHYWSLRMGKQPAAVGLLHGLLAGSLAELTEGFIWTDDGAWDYDRFPATSQELFACFLRPEMAIGPEFRSLALQSWLHIPGQVQTAVSRVSLTVKDPEKEVPLQQVTPKAWWRKLI